MKTAYVEPNLRASELEIENARLQRLVAELLARNEQLRQTLKSTTREDRLALR
jgi:hypothetical protein